ncbi:MAG TPA: aminotransferase class V-fold PLP-dependent enzyme [Bryobacteraceae bacterium]|nr:aminotransferase class V-fold PLP-dependent enzyme [Bryobacteraceae bacterium]
MNQTILRRRTFVKSGLALPAAGFSAAAGLSAAAAPGASGVYVRLGVRTFINAVGTLTTLSGTLMPLEVLRAMEDASHNFVAIHELQTKVGERLCSLTGAPAAFVTAGASAALCLASCAVTAGSDRAKMLQLPDLTGMRSEFIIQRAHRSPYDHAFRMVGGKLVTVETADEVRSSINGATAALVMVLSHNSTGHKVELDQMIEIAHKAGLPLILDAAAEVPPPENLSKFVKMGADLVAFSGGKNLRGPQCSGILIGRKDLVEAAYANSSPNNFLPRIAKVGKEEIVGLVTAVELCMNKNFVTERREFHAMLERIASRLRGLPTVSTEFIPNLDFSHSPRLSVQWDEAKLGLTLDQMVKRLREGRPSIEASDMTKFRPSWKGLGIFPYNLTAGEEIVIAERVKQILTTQG